MNQNYLYTILLVIILWMLSLTFYEFIKPSKIAYVDVNELFEGYKATQVSKQKFDKKKSELMANVDTLVQEWQKELQIFEKERSLMSVKERELKEEILQNKQLQYENYAQSVNRQVQKEEQQMTQSVINELNSYIKDYGHKHRYKLILGATGSGNILYAEDKLNITTQLLNQLNSDYNGN